MNTTTTTSCVCYVWTSPSLRRADIYIYIYKTRRCVFFFESRVCVVWAFPFGRSGKKYISTSRVFMCGHLLLSEQPKKTVVFYFPQSCVCMSACCFKSQPMLGYSGPYVGYIASFVLLLLPCLISKRAAAGKNCSCRHMRIIPSCTKDA